MTVTAKAFMTEPENEQVSITMTMTLGEWKSLLLKINPESSYPAWPVAAAIRKAIRYFEAAHEAAVEYEQ